MTSLPFNLVNRRNILILFLNIERKKTFIFQLGNMAVDQYLSPFSSYCDTIIFLPFLDAQIYTYDGSII